MKKNFFSLLILLACFTTKAQLPNSKWTGTLLLEQPTEVLLDFAKDTLTAVSTADGQVLEIMTFTVTDGVLSIKKSSGQSDCGYDVTGKYKFELKDDALVFTLVDDSCFNRAGVLDKTKWAKKK